MNMVLIAGVCFNIILWWLLNQTLPVQSYCYWYHLWLFYWLIRGTMSHWVTFYERPPFEWNFCPTVVGPSTGFVAFVHHLMLLPHIRCHRTAYIRNLLEMIPHHYRHLALHHCLDSYSVMFRWYTFSLPS